MKIRASRLPLAMVCPASSVPAEYELNSDSDPARLGTAVHEWLAGRLQRVIAAGDESFELLAVKYSLGVDDIRALSLRAWRLWREIEHWFPQAEIEVAMSKQVGGLELTGHVDCLSYQAASRTVFVNDHKTGWLDSDHADQVRAYGLLALERFPDADQVHTCIMRVRDFVTDHANYTKAELVAWSDHVVHRVLEEQQSYQPGRHCSFCPRRLTCPAFRDWVQWAVDLLQGGEIVDLVAGPTPGLARKVYDAKSTLKKTIDEVQEILRTLTLAAGGSLPFDDGYGLQNIGQIERVIQFREAWPILSRAIPESRWNEVFKITKKNLFAVIKSGYGKGEEGRAVSELMQQLEESGAMLDKAKERLEHRKLEKVS